MITHHCDGCGNVLTAPVDLAKKITFKAEHNEYFPHAWPKNDITVSTLRAVDGTWNDGDVCSDCIVRVVTGSIPRLPE